MIQLREARASDMDLLFEWANDPIVRNNSFHTEPIPYDVHKKWFEKMMSNENVLQFIMMEDDKPVGQIRLNTTDEEAEIGYSIAAESRGKGYGRKILQLIAEMINERYPHIKKLIAKVKPENEASKKIFEGEGYQMMYFSYSLYTNGGGYCEVSKEDAVFHVEVYERRIA